jgi:hypothetical protein
MKGSERTVLHLVAEATSASHERLLPVHRGFDAVRRAVAGKQAPPLPSEDLVFDQYTVTDIERAVREDLAPEPDLLASGYWTLGRTTPRHGAPWASVTIDETSSSVYFRIRTAGTFDDVEDPPQWVAWRVNSDDTQPVSSILMNASTADFWWTIEGSSLRITVVTNSDQVRSA